MTGPWPQDHSWKLQPALSHRMEYGYVELGWNVLKLWQTPRSNDRYWFAWVTGCVPDDPSPDLLSLLFANFLPSLLFLRNRFSVESTLRKLPWVNTHTHTRLSEISHASHRSTHQSHHTRNLDPRGIGSKMMDSTRPSLIVSLISINIYI